ncbi:MAG: 5'-3' exonuclease H3TH domain-containing protein, partial [Planctomycetota bacterium]|nr:5'-3' exonuclease H3TH domain-containing protein [Planctomycetota bacterium]
KLVLIDGSAYFYRAFFAIRHLSAPDGLPTNAIFGFVSMLMKVLEQQKPTHLAVVFDSKGATFREKIYPDYKGHRPAMPEDLVPQIPFIQEVVRAYNFAALAQEGFEADDIIATVTRKAEAAGMPVFIVSGDKDMMQLVSDTVVLVDTMKDRVIGPAEVKEKFGVGPEGVVDVLGLMGDSVDNVPGVPGVGEKTARELIENYGTLENVLSHAADVCKAKVRESLQQNAQLARLSKELVTLRTDVPIPATLDEYRLRPPDEAKLVALFERLGFARFLDKYKRTRTISYDDYHLVATEAELESMLAELRAAPAFSFDLETTSADPISAEIVGLSFSPRAHRAFYCPVGHRYLGAPPQLPLKRTLELLRPILEEPAKKKYGQNLKYDTTVLGRRGIRVAGIACDTMIASYLLDPNRRAHGLAALALQFLDHKMISYEDVTGKGKKQINFSEVEVQTACTYSCEDADVAFILSEMFLGKLKECSTGVSPVPAG